MYQNFSSKSMCTVSSLNQYSFLSSLSLLMMTLCFVLISRSRRNYTGDIRTSLSFLRGLQSSGTLFVFIFVHNTIHNNFLMCAEWARAAREYNVQRSSAIFARPAVVLTYRSHASWWDTFLLCQCQLYEPCIMYIRNIY